MFGTKKEESQQSRKTAISRGNRSLFRFLVSAAHAETDDLAEPVNLMEQDTAADCTPASEESVRYNDTVWSEKGLISEPQNKTGGAAWSIILSLVMIVGGLSGKLVLRGTESSPALVVVGFLLLGYNIFSIIKNRKDYDKAMEEYYAHSDRVHALETEISKNKTALENPVTLTLKWDSDKGICPSPKINGYSMKKDETGKLFVCELIQVSNLLSFSDVDFVLSFDVPEGAGAMTFVLRCNGITYGIDFPEGVHYTVK